ncbi:exodeoxyribonuclease V subunit beta [Candidatus Venteria ishoeyi]|uniref:RecBCD enzyme subunit RecB n=1 Tax=Candidatus Venteria ishoeyi TaxID=1899563 RepID=A0A1H6FGQ7_9GAMM|nr:exodeoxyribonuclease V subunit beta [Candidatus Venteria ishoeyi]SEH08539.1 RecBCD enzyme subunit RecB [Candidatus Venteria ishoeyi]
MQTFDPVYSQLNGINLIEASAGTGKTYTIATLVLRLLLEQHLDIQQILVVTFTESATAELRDRVRHKIVEALAHLNADFYGSESIAVKPDETLSAILAQQKNTALCRKRLEKALHHFDEAAIYTIHGFCQRMLLENAFESGILFGTELLKDQTDLLEEIVLDFWRIHFYPDTDPQFLDYLMGRGYGPEKLTKFLRGKLGQAFLKRIPELNTESSTELPDKDAEADLLQAYITAFEEMRQSWPVVEVQVMKLLLQHPDLSRNKYRITSLQNWQVAMQQLCALAHPPIQVFEKFAQFTNNKLQEGTKKNGQTPEHVFFDLCDSVLETREALLEAYTQRELWLKHQLFDYAEAEFKKRKHALHQQSFDDLLQNLYFALVGEHGAALAEAIRKQYAAALIDEFQDTDPLQYAIFQHLFPADAQQAHSLFLIGDPKQAIYSFRGADIFTYLSAANDAHQRYTLDTNWRSKAALIAAVNQLFGRENPFLLEEIQFRPVNAPQSASKKSITKKPSAAMTLWFTERAAARQKDKKPIDKKWAKRFLPERVAGEILRLLNESDNGAEEAVMAGDIAVLVRSNQQAIEMQAALQQHRIPSVLYSRESLFASHEVVEMLHLMAAILEPWHERRLRTALATDLLGVDGNALEALADQEAVWERWLFSFQHWHERWHQHGFIQMFRNLLQQQHIAERLLQYPDGERRLTNLLHLSEVLQQASTQPQRGMHQLYQWLAQQSQQRPDDDVYQLRLESDAAAVKLVTIHKSKGLEYPVVFVPFAWDGLLRAGKDEICVFHDRDNAQRMLDLGSEDLQAHQNQAEHEEQAENLRLLYVAITRAKHHCYLVWGAFKDAQTSALGHLLHGSDTNIIQTPDTELRQDLDRLAANSQGCIQVNDLPQANVQAASYYPVNLEQQPVLEARPFSGKIPLPWSFASFTALVVAEVHTQQNNAQDNSEYQVDERLQRTGETSSGIATGETKQVDGSLSLIEETGHGNTPHPAFLFPAGANAGNFLHELLEHLNFNRWQADNDPGLFLHLLQAYGFAEELEAALYQWLDAILNTPLEQAENTAENNGEMPLTLAQLNNQQRLNELEFYFPLAKINTRGLYQILHPVWQQHWSKTFAMPPEFPPLEGFMMGFIDLVFEWQGRFYLVDYKSNRLGEDIADYHQDRLLAAMQEKHYLLQYHIYTVALHRYLQQRIADYHYDTHFGGVYYLFLRGMRPDLGADYGIFQDRPELELIEQLSEYFGQE